jgi:hypothetical protein
MEGVEVRRIISGSTALNSLVLASILMRVALWTFDSVQNVVGGWMMCQQLMTGSTPLFGRTNSFPGLGTAWTCLQLTCRRQRFFAPTKS